MNLGIYLNSLSQHDQLKQASDAINSSIYSKKLHDASIFYDNIAPNPFNVKCGLFHSTDLWNFSGVLITTSLSTTIKSIHIVNNIDLYYYYGLEDQINPLSLFYLLSNRVKIISKTKADDNDLYRKTGVSSSAVCEDFSDIINTLGKIYG